MLWIQWWGKNCGLHACNCVNISVNRWTSAVPPLLMTNRSPLLLSDSQQPNKGLEFGHLTRSTTSLEHGENTGSGFTTQNCDQSLKITSSNNNIFLCLTLTLPARRPRGTPSLSRRSSGRFNPQLYCCRICKYFSRAQKTSDSSAALVFWMQTQNAEAGRGAGSERLGWAFREFEGVKVTPCHPEIC